jgi:hypothetical protein
MREILVGQLSLTRETSSVLPNIAERVDDRSVASSCPVQSVRSVHVPPTAASRPLWHSFAHLRADGVAQTLGYSSLRSRLEGARPSEERSQDEARGGPQLFEVGTAPRD